MRTKMNNVTKALLKQHLYLDISNYNTKISDMRTGIVKKISIDWNNDEEEIIKKIKEDLYEF